MPTVCRIAALALATLALVPPVAATDLSQIPDASALPVASPVPLPDTPNQPPDVCFAYNPDAFTNLCFEYDPRTVAATGVSRSSEGLCLVGDQCVSVHPETHRVPAYAFYVEATIVCDAGREPCRFEN